jgi:hypothetical protein
MQINSQGHTISAHRAYLRASNSRVAEFLLIDPNDS